MTRNFFFQTLLNGRHSDRNANARRPEQLLTLFFFYGPAWRWKARRRRWRTGAACTTQRCPASCTTGRCARRPSSSASCTSRTRRTASPAGSSTTQVGALAKSNRIPARPPAVLFVSTRVGGIVASVARVTRYCARSLSIGVLNAQGSALS